MQSKERIKSMDVLRGLMASSIMFYHNYSAFYGDVESDNVIERLGTYGVSIFYILSGLTLFIVYKNSLQNTFKSILSFFIKRIFRIFPLFWIAVISTMVIKNHFWPWKVIVINMSGLFSVFDRITCIAEGQWSIGNELVFYAFFPLYFLAAKFSKHLFYALVSISFMISFYFAFEILNTNNFLEYQWSQYIHPLNQICLFAGGIFIGYFISKKDFSTYSRTIKLIFFSSILLFIFYPSHGDSISIVTNINRIVFVLICFLICFSTYYQKFRVHSLLSRFFTVLGEASYSIYLLHPVILLVIKFILPDFSPIIFIPISIVTTIFVSYLVYITAEKYFMQLGRTIIKKYNI